MELAAARAQQVETYERLSRALEQQNQLHEVSRNSTKLVMVLLSMIDKLERRITNLTGEADQLRAAQADAAILARTQQQLTRAQEQERRAQQELARAQKKQRQAEDLAAQVQARVDQLADELDRLRASGPENAASDSGSIQSPHQPTISAAPLGTTSTKPWSALLKSTITTMTCCSASPTISTLTMAPPQLSRTSGQTTSAPAPTPGIASPNQQAPLS